MPKRHTFNNARQNLEPIGVDRSDAAFVIWDCPRCAWYRIRTNKEGWETTVIPHPLYGNITNYDAYVADIAGHNCLETRAARIRYGINPDARFNGLYIYRVPEKVAS